MRAELEARYRSNLQRVRGLVQTYRQLSGGGSGRRPVETVDVLRSAVVFLHATLEDLLRALLARRWPRSQDPVHFEKLGFALGTGRPEKVDLKSLLSHRHKSVQELFDAAIEAELDHKSFNNVGELKVALERSGIDPVLVSPHAQDIAAMMTRRHQIVHRADRHDLPGSGNHAGASIGTGTVEAWIASVDAVCHAILAQV